MSPDSPKRKLAAIMFTEIACGLSGGCRMTEFIRQLPPMAGLIPQKAGHPFIPSFPPGIPARPMSGWSRTGKAGEEQALPLRGVLRRREGRYRPLELRIEMITKSHPPVFAPMDRDSATPLKGGVSDFAGSGACNYVAVGINPDSHGFCYSESASRRTKNLGITTINIEILRSSVSRRTHSE